MTLSEEQIRQYWEKRNPEQWEAGREAARRDIGSGLLRLQLSADELYLTPSISEVLSETADLGLDYDIYGDVSGPDPAYVLAYNLEMEAEIARRYGQGVLRAWLERDALGRAKRAPKGD